MAQAPQDSPQNEEPPVNVGAQVNAVDKSTDSDAPQPNDPDAQELLIGTLRSQIQDLFSQVTQLNGKLVRSYDRVSDLEDDLHVASANARTSSLKISQLELERTQHLSALNTGLLVEKSHVTTELTRLMEKATEEAAQRGQAESAKANIEKELDDLSANLFQQANSMVAEARFAQALSERKVEESEQAQKRTEELLAVMQQQMQSLQAEKENAQHSANNLRALMGKGKWVERSEDHRSITAVSLRLLCSHAPYQDFLLFVAHLRSIHPSSPQPPAMSTLLPLPFLARLLSEDSEPTVRLDLAPSLNWLSRRSVLSAIHNGQLIIEPISTSSLLSQNSPSYSSTPVIPGTNSTNTNISCALCGTSIFPASPSDSTHTPRPPSHPLASLSRTISSNQPHRNSWSSSLFKNLSSDSRPPTPPPRSPSRTLPHLTETKNPSYPQQVHVFRLSSPSSTTPPHMGISDPNSSSVSFTSASTSQHPHHPSQVQSQQARITMYPLCTSGWCLNRLRTTCSLWALVRSGIVEKVWEEEVPVLPPPIQQASRGGAPPPVPPRRRGLWGMASALGERVGEKAASWSEGDKEKKEPKSGKWILPPPTHPSEAPHVAPGVDSHPAPKMNEGRGRRLPPPIDPEPDVNDVKANGVTMSQKTDVEGEVQEATTVPDPHDATTTAQASAATVPIEEGSVVPEKSHSSVSGTETSPKPHVEAQIRPLDTPRPSSEVSGEDSQESFSTPTEEVANPLDRTAPVESLNPSTAEASLLTPKATLVTPSTDAAEGQDNPGPTTSEPVLAADSKTSPPADSAALPSESKGALSSASSPPPLPRRAAARARGGTPNTVVSKLPEGSNAEAEPDRKDMTPPPPATELTSEPTVTDEPEECFPEQATLSPHNSEVALTSDAKSEVLSVSIYSTNSRNTAQEKELEPSLLNGKTGKEVNGDVATANEDREVYIGNATWEERTWKELVKLREDMFWARIGGLR